MTLILMLHCIRQPLLKLMYIIILFKISFAYKLINKLDEATQFINKGIMNLEKLDKIIHQQKSHAIEISLGNK